MEGFEFIRNNVFPTALFLYPEENLLIYGERKVIWSALEIYRSGERFSLSALFWANDSEEMNEVLRVNGVDHILIKKCRIYDDSKEHHFGGYPQSFVEKLPHLDGWVKIFENSGVSLWKKAQP